MTAVNTTTAPAEATSIPPLRDGDRLSRAEFERRYDAMPHLKKAELIDGVVYMPSPVTEGQHGGPHFDLIGWLAFYRTFTPGVIGGDNSSLRLQLDNEPQPDAYLRILPSHGGQSGTSAGGYVEGAPELVAEVAASSAPYDLGAKFHAYRRNQVREYVVWRVLDQAIDWFVLREDQYEPLPPGGDGLYRSVVFPGLWLDPAALVRGDLLAVFHVVQRGVATPEHADFVARLQQQAAQPS
jgi:Uma2 family endonuclease